MRVAFVLCILAACPDLAGQVPELVLDINTRSEGDPASDPTDGAQIGAWTYFFAYGGPASLGRELYRTRGTPATTELVADINPGVASSRAQSFLGGMAVLGERVLFHAIDGVHGSELWRSNGTAAGTALVKDVWPGATGSGITDLLAIGGTVFFAANDGALGRELWRSDGTEAGTMLVVDLRPGAQSAAIGLVAEFNGELLFSADDGVHGVELWLSDGTAAGTRLLKDIVPGPVGSVFSSGVNHAQLGNVMLFEADSALWQTDGTEAGTFLVHTTNPRDLTRAGDLVFFASTDPVHGEELWCSDGTTAGTFLVRDIAPGSWSSFPENFTELDGILLFTAASAVPRPVGQDDFELWRSDGTEAGTYRVKDIAPGLFSSQPDNLFVLGNEVLFFLFNKGQLWRTDGTEAGTQLVRTFGITTPNWVVGTNTTGYAVVAADDYTGMEPWVTDGTAAGTKLLVNINPPVTPSTHDADPAEFVDLFGVTLFVADDDVHGRELWRTDGTAAGTWLVADILPGSEGSIRFPTVPMTRAGNAVFFLARADANGYDALWRSDGTAAGTSKVWPAGSEFIYLDEMVAVDDVLFFSADDGVSGEELWKSDGTLAGTVLVRDIDPGPMGSVDNLVALGGLVIFSARSPAEGSELWRSDGTEAGTWMVADLSPGSTSSNPQGFAAASGAVYFSADTEQYGREPWRTDGTPAGTWLLADISPGSASSTPGSFVEAGGTVYFEAASPSVGRELWKTDGTPAGTSLVLDIEPGTSGSSPSPAEAIGNKLLFIARQTGLGREPWISDGTAAGTRPLGNLNPVGNSSPLFLTAIGTRTVYFAGDDGQLGYEVWATDGTTEGTRLVADLFPGPTASDPQEFTLSGGRLLFVARHPLKGNELWRYDPGATSQNVGTPCPPGLISLRASDPVLGAGMELVVRGAQPGAPGVMLLGLPSAPVPLAGVTCPLYVSPPTAVVLLLFAPTTSTWSTTVPLPGTPALLGVRIALQALHGSALPIDATNGVFATLGR